MTDEKIKRDCDKCEHLKDAHGGYCKPYSCAQYVNMYHLEFDIFKYKKCPDFKQKAADCSVCANSNHFNPQRVNGCVGETGCNNKDKLEIYDNRQSGTVSVQCKDCRECFTDEKDTYKFSSYPVCLKLCYKVRSGVTHKCVYYKLKGEMRPCAKCNHALAKTQEWCKKGREQYVRVGDKTSDGNVRFLECTIFESIPLGTPTPKGKLRPCKQCYHEIKGATNCENSYTQNIRVGKGSSDPAYHCCEGGTHSTYKFKQKICEECKFATANNPQRKGGCVNIIGSCIDHDKWQKHVVPVDTKDIQCKNCNACVKNYCSRINFDVHTETYHKCLYYKQAKKVEKGEMRPCATCQHVNPKSRETCHVGHCQYIRTDKPVAFSTGSVYGKCPNYKPVKVKTRLNCTKCVLYEPIDDKTYTCYWARRNMSDKITRYPKSVCSLYREKPESTKPIRGTFPLKNDTGFLSQGFPYTYGYKHTSMFEWDDVKKSLHEKNDTSDALSHASIPMVKLDMSRTEKRLEELESDYEIEITRRKKLIYSIIPVSKEEEEPKPYFDQIKRKSNGYGYSYYYGFTEQFVDYLRLDKEHSKFLKKLKITSDNKYMGDGDDQKLTYFFHMKYKDKDVSTIDKKPWRIFAHILNEAISRKDQFLIDRITKKLCRLSKCPEPQRKKHICIICDTKNKKSATFCCACGNRMKALK